MKRAFLVGLNYPRDASLSLKGPSQDVAGLAACLAANGYEDIVVDTDADAPYTGDAFLAHLLELAARAQPGDTVWIHYSGHGESVYDRDGDETDMRDECIVIGRTDFVSDDMLRVALDRFDAGVRVMITMDCCHSGTICDLAYTWDMDRDDVATYNSHYSTKADVTMISGCMDAQYSMDVYVRERAANMGIMSHCLIECLTADPSLEERPVDLKARIGTMLKERKYVQRPILTTSRATAAPPQP